MGSIVSLAPGTITAERQAYNAARYLQKLVAEFGNGFNLIVNIHIGSQFENRDLQFSFLVLFKAGASPSFNFSLLYFPTKCLNGVSFILWTISS
jgi:hypothetical protein